MSGSSDSAEAAGIYTVSELLAHSLAIETEAADRYTELADQMEVHNNLEVAQLFRRMAEIEGKHIAKVQAMSADAPLPHIAPWDMHWIDEESPESPSLDDAHYLMTPYQALQLALQGERRAVDFFERVGASADDVEVRRMAAELAEEEREHVALIERWLARYRQPEPGWDEDHDPPAQQE